MRTLLTAAAVVLLIMLSGPLYAHENELLLLPRVPLSFCGVLGAVTLVLLGVGLNFPFSLMVSGALSVVALSRFGRKRWRIWIAAGIVYAMPSLYLYADRHLYRFSPLGGVAYEFVGVVSASLVGAIAIWMLYARAIKPRLRI